MINNTEQHINTTFTAEAFRQLQQENINQKIIIENLTSENLYFKNELEKLKRMIFGSKSERFESSV